MVYALLCAALFACSAFYAARSAASVGVQRATVVRIVLAAVVLGSWTCLRGSSLTRQAVAWLALGGALGMGLGDIAMFHAIPRIGGRLTTVLAQCLTAPLALLAEWLWLGTTVRAEQVAAVGVVLVGIALSLGQDQAAEPRPQVSRRQYALGVLCGGIDALGTALGAVASRKALDCLPAGNDWDGVGAAFCRIAAGAVVTLLYYRPLLVYWARSRAALPPLGPTLRQYRYTFANALCGSVLGMVAFQRALAALPAGVVVAITATSPLGTIALLWLCDGIRPTRRTSLGGVVAVAGVVALHALAGPR